MVAKTLTRPNFEPLSDFILVKPIPRGQTQGGIALPDTTDLEEPGEGEVIKVGPGRVTEEGIVIEPCVQVGDRVYLFFAYNKPISIKFSGVDYAIVRARDVIGRVETH